MPALKEVPEDLAQEIYEEDLNPWTWYLDRDGDIWAATPHRHDGEQVMVPFCGGERPATRSSVEAVYGPLVEEPHCPVCGTTLFWEDGVCEFRLDTIRHPVR